MTGDSDESGVDWRSATIYLLIAAAIMGPMDSPLISPALPGAKAALGLTDAQVGLFITVLALPGIVFAPLLGMAADRYGRTRILAGCLAIYGLAGGLVPFAGGVEFLPVGEFQLILALRFLQGLVGSSMLASLAMTLVGDLYDGTTRNAAMGVLGGAITFSVAVYPTLGGVLADVDWRLPFLVYLTSVVVGLAVVLGLDEPTSERTPMGIGYLRNAIAAVPTRRAAFLYGAASWSFLLLFGGVITVVPLVLDQGYGLSASVIGGIISLTLLVTAIVSTLNARLVARLSTGTLIAGGFVCYGLGLAGAGVAPTPTLIAAALLCFGLGHGLTFPTLASAIAGLTDSRFRAGVLSVRTSMLLAGQAVGSWLFPKVGAAVGYMPLLVGFGAISVLIGLAALGVLTARGDVRATPV